MILDSLRINKNVLDLLEAYVSFQLENDFPPSNKIIVVNSTEPKSIVPQINFINDGWSITSPSFNYKKLNTETDYANPLIKYKSKGFFGCSNGEKMETFYSDLLHQTIQSIIKKFIAIKLHHQTTMNLI